jgi:hypothetical protein
MHTHVQARTEVRMSHICKHTLTPSYLYISYVPLFSYTGTFLHFRVDKLLVSLQFQCSIKVSRFFSFFISRIKPVTSSSFHEIHFFEAYELVKFSVGGLSTLCITPEHGGMRVSFCFLRWVCFTIPQPPPPTPPTLPFCQGLSSYDDSIRCLCSHWHSPQLP